MKFEITTENLLLVGIPVLLISIIFLFFIYKLTSQENNNIAMKEEINTKNEINNLLHSAKSATDMVEKSARIIENKANILGNCGPNFAPNSNNSYKFNTNSDVQPSCGAGMGAPVPQQAPPQQAPPQQAPPPRPPVQEEAPKKQKPPTPPQKRNQVPNGKTAEVKMVWAQWCGFSRKAEPEFTKLRNDLSNTQYNGYTLVFNDHEEGHSDFREMVTKYEIRGFPTYVVIVKDNGVEKHVGKFNSIKRDDMETKLKKEIDNAK